MPPEIFRQAVDQAALAISITDAKARILYVNESFRRVTGYAADEVVGQNEAILSYKVTPRIVYETMWAQLMRQRAWNGLLVNRRKDGSRYLADLTITPVLDKSGRTSHFLGMHRDVTEMHRLERQVQNQKALIESVVDAAPVAIVVLDEVERVVLDNQDYKKLIGELGPEPAATLLAALHARMGVEFEWARSSGRGFAGREVRFDRDGGKPRWFACSGSWIEELDSSADAFYEPVRRQYMLLVIQEITALKEQQEAIRVNALRAVLAEQERIQSLRETLSGAVFQLQGPFNLLAAAVRMLERHGQANGDDPLAAGLEEALRAGTQALDTLRACIPSPGEEAVQTLNVNEILHNVLRVFTARLLADGVTIDWRPADGMPAVPGRLTRLSGLFKILVENALDAIREARGERREIRLSVQSYADRVEVLVEDSGPGVPEEWRYKVFEPFFTTKGADVQHMGMGLAMAQDIAAEHGGLVEIDDAPDGGCRVRVQLPAA